MSPPPSRARRARALVALACALGVAAPPAPVRAQALPDLGDVAQSLLSPAQERRLGEQIMREIRASGAYLNDPEVNAYLNELGYRLVAASPDPRQDFEFFAINDGAVNAFALPGGFIGVHTGLILLTQSESELASVIAHEIAHVTQRHIARMLAGQEKSIWISLAALAAAIIAARAGQSQAAQAAIATSQALQIQNQLDYTREHEREADRIGLQILDKAAFDVRGMPAMFERLQRASRFVESNAPSYLRTHPVTYERIAEAQDRIHDKPYKQVRDSLDFQLVRALVRSYQGTPREAVAFFEDALAERKYSSEEAARYGLVASLLRAQDFPRATAELKTLERVSGKDPMVEAMAGQVLLQSGRLDVAIARYEDALKVFPSHKQLVYDYPDALLKARRPAEAVKYVDAQLLRYPSDATLHRLAARAYAEVGNRFQQHRHLGEYYAWAGNLGAAIDQLDLAVKAGDGDFYQLSAVETRLRSLRRDQAELQKTLRQQQSRLETR